MAVKKLRGKGTIEIDDQILRWRQKLKKEAVTLGKHTAKDKDRSKKYREERKDMELVRQGKRKFFE